MTTLIEASPNAIREMIVPDLTHMVDKFRNASFGNWLEIIGTTRFRPYKQGVGEHTEKTLVDLRKRLLGHKMLLRENQAHDIKFAFHGKGYYSRRIYVIDGFPIEFISEDVNRQMEWLLRGDQVLIRQDEKLSKNIKAEICFMNEYFGFKLIAKEYYDTDKKTQAIRLKNLKGLNIY